MKTYSESCDLFVAGGGPSGICTAIQAGRMGLKVILAEKEMLLGGNAGPNMGVAPTAAMITNPYYNEMGLIEEIEERISARRVRMVPTIVNYNIMPELDVILTEMLEEAHVAIYRRHLVLECEKSGNRICRVTLLNLENLDRVVVETPGTLADCTGEAHLAQLSGADLAIGRESKKETGERSAPDTADAIVSASSLTAVAVDTGIECPFIPPEGTPDWNPEKPCSRFDPSQRVHFLWQVDEGGESEDNHPSYSPQALYLHLMKRIFSQWNYLKNVLYREELKTHQLIWISPILGRRESYRILGDYLLTQTDIEENRRFPDAIAFGGSFMDEHLPSFDGGYEVRYYSRPLPYDIPYRCIYSRNVENLFSGGRSVGVSHLAFTSVRLIRTGCTLAQAAGIAAFLCRKYSCTPRDVGNAHLEELQQLLILHDVFLPGKRLSDPLNLAQSAEIAADTEASPFDETQEVSFVSAKDGVEVILYDYPSQLDELTFYARNSSPLPVSATVTAAYGRTPDQEYWQAPATWIDPKDGTFHEGQGEVAPEGTSEIRSVKGCRNYFIRRDSLKEETVLKTVSVQVPAGYTGAIRVNNHFGTLPPPCRTIWRQALILKIRGEFEVAMASPLLDTVEGSLNGNHESEGVPVVKIKHEPLSGKALNVIDGFIHREGQSRLHAWISGSSMPQHLTMKWKQAVDIQQILIRFDITERLWRDMYISRGKSAPERLVRSFQLEIRDGNEWRVIHEERENHYRFARIDLPKAEHTNMLRLTVLETWNGGPARINEISIYNKRVIFS